MGSGEMTSGEMIQFLLLLSLSWAVFGYWGSRIARNKGYSARLGFVAGFFGGIIGVLVLYLLRPSGKTERGGQASPPTSTPGTGTPGTDMFRRDHQPGIDKTPPGAPRKTRVCHRCGRLTTGELEDCPYCGRPL